MSLRNLRKFTGDQGLPPPEGDSDEEYEPLYTKKVENNFKDLVINSESEDEKEEVEAEVEDTEEEVVKKNTKKNKKKKKKQKKARNISVEEPSTSRVNMQELDEIDKSVMEVNAILGAPVELPAGSAQENAAPPVNIMMISAKFLDATEELNRVFGPEEIDGKKRPRQSRGKMMKRAIVLPTPDSNYLIRYHNGWSMSIHRQTNDVIFFTFDHNREYQKILRSLIALYAQWDGPMNWFPEELSGPKALVEEALHKMDTMFYVEEYSFANTMLEQTIAYLQSVVHLSFNVTNKKTRLEYKFRENRPFHILLLKYAYMLTNKACHRTSLEVAKILLNLDPSDPLAVVLIIDTLAIRAREYKWLVDAVELWSKERNAGFLFNIQYSHSLAHFHLLHKNEKKEPPVDTTVADRFLQNAIIRFPAVVMKIFEACSVNPGPRIKEHPLFRQEICDRSKNLYDLMGLYAKFAWSRWKEPPVMKWLTRNVNEMVDKFDNNLLVKELTHKLARKRRDLFQVWPPEITRHLTVIQPMAKLLIDGEMPHVERGISFDPVPPEDTIDRYNYKNATRFEYEPMRNNVMYELFAAIVPTYQAPANPEPARRHRALEPIQDIPFNHFEGVRINRRQPPPPRDDESVRNNLFNSVGEVRNALMQFLGEWYDGYFNTDVHSLERPVENRRVDGNDEPE